MPPVTFVVVLDLTALEHSRSEHGRDTTPTFRDRHEIRWECFLALPERDADPLRAWVSIDGCEGGESWDEMKLYACVFST